MSLLQVTGNIISVTSELILQIGVGLYMLDLSDCNINNIEQGAFNSLNDLISLKLSNNNIRKISSKMFSSSHLRVLYLDGNGLENIENDAFAQLKKLQKLYLQHNTLQEMSITLPGSLNILDISHNHISTIATDLSKVRYFAIKRGIHAMKGHWKYVFQFDVYMFSKCINNFPLVTGHLENILWIYC
jgi:Leucine-rich repeat (LRR) protein